MNIYDEIEEEFLFMIEERRRKEKRKTFRRYWWYMFKITWPILVSLIAIIIAYTLVIIYG